MAAQKPQAFQESGDWLDMPPRDIGTAELGSYEKGAPCLAPYSFAVAKGLGRLQGLGSRCPSRRL
jgi:hypothetical protein